MLLKRRMYPIGHPKGPTIGDDVQIMKHALRRYESNFFYSPPYDRTFGKVMKDAVKVLQRLEGIEQTGEIGQPTFDVLWRHLDAYRQYRYKRFEPPVPPPVLTPQDEAFGKLVEAMQMMDEHSPGYLLGGGHGVPLYKVSAYQRLDCSSSTSKALYEADLFEGRQIARVSGEFSEWGKPGPGFYFTVYYNYEHVFIRLHKTRWWRFDTSPHGDGGTGPRLRLLPRFTSGFGIRHYPGM